MFRPVSTYFPSVLSKNGALDEQTGERYNIFYAFSKQHAKMEVTIVRKVWLAALLTGLFLLMLSALVVTPADEAAPVRLLPAPADQHAVLLPMPAPQAPSSADAPARSPEWKLAVWSAVLAICCMAASAAQRDANGHVLRSVRYENSVYQLFRPEMAGG